MAVAPGLAAVQVAVTPVPAPVATTVTPLAAAPPAAFCTLTVSGITWPVVTGDGGWAAYVTVRTAPARTVVEGEVVAAAPSAAPELAAVPLAVAVR